MFFHKSILAANILASLTYANESSCSNGLKVETHVNVGAAAQMVSSLIVGSQAAVLIDVPFTIEAAEELVAWIRNTTDKPLVAAFTTHFHPDHFLSGGAVLDAFPDIAYYASNATAELIKKVAPEYVNAYEPILGPGAITHDTAIPTAYDSSFFVLPGDTEYPIHLLHDITGDSVDETIFWIPSISTLITGDITFNTDYNVWLADQRTPELTESWLATLDLIEGLRPRTIIPGHSSQTDSSFRGNAAVVLHHTKSYVEFFRDTIQSASFTKSEMIGLFENAFGVLNGSATSTGVLASTAEQFGSDGAGIPSYIDLTKFGDIGALNSWIL